MLNQVPGTPREQRKGALCDENWWPNGQAGHGPAAASPAGDGGDEAMR